MAEANTGVRSILGVPGIFDWYQRFVGANRQRRILVDRYIQPRAGDRVLDVGCGTAEILDFLPDGIRYEGFDLNERYIEKARRRYGERGRFECRRVSEQTLGEGKAFEIVLAYGILHHLDDGESAQLFSLASRALVPGGRLVTIDPCRTPDQSALSRFMVGRDRGQNVRNQEGYQTLARAAFSDVQGHVHHDLLYIPYTHYVMVCRRTAAATVSTS